MDARRYQRKVRIYPAFLEIAPIRQAREFDSADIATYSVLGTKGKLRLDMAYEYATEICMEVAIGEKKQRRTYEKRDQFGAELVLFF